MRKQRQAERNWKPPQIETLTQKQAAYVDLMTRHSCVLSVGPAGTGKTYLACAFAGQALYNKNTRQVILARPTTPLGRTMGFLPGDIKRKMAPWARPLTEAFKQHMGSVKFDEAINQGLIKIEALEYIRGLTFDDAVLILDEAQNSTPVEMKALLTRIGENSRVILCGDTSQSDLNPTENGLAWALKAVKRGLVSNAGVVEFTSADTVRSELCRMWAEAFDVLEKETPATGRFRLFLCASSK